MSWWKKLFGGGAEPAAAEPATPLVIAARRGEYDRDRFRADLKHHEGLALRIYTDTVGKRSIGIGRNLDDVGISEAEAWVLAENDIDRAERDLDRYLPWWRDLDDVRMRVLLDMCFNMGIGSAASGRGLLSFVNTLEKIRAGRYDEAAAGMLASKWAGQVKGRASRLAQMMRTGRDA